MDYLHWINTDPSYFCSWIRCIILFCLSVLLFRFTNHRFNISTPLDFLIIAISGGIISRGIAGASSLGITVEALLTLIILHLILSKLCFFFTKLGFLFKGCSHYLIKDGVLDYKSMRRFSISENDLLAQLRQQLNTENYSLVDSAILERTGNISFIKKEDK
ncbi:YetF domain-containing protein (plasmid) [Legionella sp. D16C41]|uniref:YetF domain-containing protein n=1 Tax=Legionella sp. D16C41 TaxID=3402688 RepID=UPI003AF650AB